MAFTVIRGNTSFVLDIIRATFVLFCWKAAHFKVLFNGLNGHFFETFLTTKRSSFSSSSCQFTYFNFVTEHHPGNSDVFQNLAALGFRIAIWFSFSRLAMKIGSFSLSMSSIGGNFCG